MPVVVSVAQGGTGANTSAAALTALGAAPTAAYTQANNAYAAANTASNTANSSNTAIFSNNGLLFRNRIINGDMRIDQRNAGVAVTVNSPSGTYTVDRWICVGQSADGVYTVQQVSDAPAGFVNSAKITVTTADASIGASQNYDFQQMVEGNNVADFSFGTASAQTITVSFWVKSSVTGTFGAVVSNSAQNRVYPFSYVISSANTWEKKAITITGDTTGTWLTNNGIGLRLRISLGAGTNFLGTAGAWTTTTLTGVTGQTNLISTLNATLFITGVQLEPGSAATPFERRPFGTELMLCQRYLPALVNPTATGLNITTSAAYIAMPFAVPARVAPTGVTMSTPGALYASNGSNFTITSTTFIAAGVSGAFVQPAIATASLTATAPAFLYAGTYLFTGVEL